jgi:hypothetical protein
MNSINLYCPSTEERPGATQYMNHYVHVNIGQMAYAELDRPRTRPGRAPTPDVLPALCRSADDPAGVRPVSEQMLVVIGSFACTSVISILVFSIVGTNKNICNR